MSERSAGQVTGRARPGRPAKPLVIHTAPQPHAPQLPCTHAAATAVTRCHRRRRSRVVAQQRAQTLRHGLCGRPAAAVGKRTSCACRPCHPCPWRCACSGGGRRVEAGASVAGSEQECATQVEASCQAKLSGACAFGRHTPCRPPCWRDGQEQAPQLGLCEGSLRGPRSSL